MAITLIAAMTPNRVIGNNNSLLWNLPADLAWFKEHTLNKPILMGRKTYESIGRPLPNRTNIVVSHTPDKIEGVENRSFLIDVLEEFMHHDMMVIGGGEIYKQTMPFADRLIITEVHCLHEGDTYFPEINKDIWRVVSVENHSADDKNQYSRTNYIYERR